MVPGRRDRVEQHGVEHMTLTTWPIKMEAGEQKDQESF